MTAADLIRLCLELDQQIVSPRPSEWGKAARLVAKLCEYADSRDNSSWLGDWKSVDLSQVFQIPPRWLDQPILDKLFKAHEFLSGDDV